MKQISLNFPIDEKLRDDIKAHVKSTGVKLGFWLAKAARELLEREQQPQKKEK